MLYSPLKEILMALFVLRWPWKSAQNFTLDIKVKEINMDRTEFAIDSISPYLGMSQQMEIHASVPL
jgi:hypothetical protein